MWLLSDGECYYCFVLWCTWWELHTDIVQHLFGKGYRNKALCMYQLPGLCCMKRLQPELSKAAFTRQTKVGKLVLVNSGWRVWTEQKQSANKLANCWRQIELFSTLANSFTNFFVLVNSPGGVLPYKGLMGTCGQPGYVFRDFCLKQGIEFIIFCLNQGTDFSIFVLNRISFLGR